MRSSLSRSVVPSLAAAMIALHAVPSMGAALQPETKPGDRPAGQPGGAGPGGRPTRPGGPGGGPSVSVEGAMKAINRGMRQLRDQIADAAKKDDNLRILGEMQRAAVVAKGQPLPPSMLADAKDDAEKAKRAQTFRSELIGAVRAMLDIEQDVADGKGDAAKAKLQNLIKIRDHGHAALGVNDEDDEAGPGKGEKDKGEKDKGEKDKGEKDKGEHHDDKHDKDKPGKGG